MTASDIGENRLGAYLRDRRAKLDPASFGLPLKRRRTPGLRREEVAQRWQTEATRVADYLTAVTRTGSVAVTGLGITIGGALTFQLGELLHMEHPLLDELPGLPWYFALVFSALGAIGNALANGGWLKLLVPATVIGVITGAANQALSVAAGFNTLWANAGAASAQAVAMASAVRATRVVRVMGFPPVFCNMCMRQRSSLPSPMIIRCSLLLALSSSDRLKIFWTSAQSPGRRGEGRALPFSPPREQCSAR